MALAQGQVGVQTSGPGSAPIVRSLYSGEVGVADVHGKYQEAVTRGNCYTLFQTAVSQATAATFPYAAGGTAPISLFNPAGSGKDMVILAAAVSVQTPGTAAVTLDYGFSLTTTLVTGTVVRTTPTNLLTLQNAGSVGFGSLIVVLTGNTIQNSIITFPLCSFGLTTVTTPGPNPAPAFFDVGGLIMVAPGNQLVLGSSAITSTGPAKVDMTLIWEEVAVAS
jgi:hypothetical protein